MQIATSGPDSPYASIKHSYFAAITKAERYVYISTPYLLPDNAILTALRVAALSGVDVRVLIPVRGDNMIVAWASYAYIDALMESGVKVYLYQRGFNHSKFIVIDDELCTVGSANLDYRSFEDDFEVQAIIYDNATTCELRNHFLADLEDAVEVTPDYWAKRPTVSKIMEPIAKLLAPLF
jgi:cardiolipin synthase